MSDIVLNGNTYADVEHVVYNGSEVINLYVNGERIWHTYDPILANNSWEDISVASKSGLASSLWNIGDQTTITVSGKKYTVDIIGFDHDIVADAKSYGRDTAGITFQMHDTIEQTEALDDDEKNTVWTTMDMYTTGLPNYFEQLNSDLKVVIVPVVKQTYIYESTSTSSSASVVTTTDNLFLLSYTEAFGLHDTDNNINKEGTQYAYYSSGNSYLKNNAYWTRTTRLHFPTCSFYCTTEDRIGWLSVNRSGSRCISFAFCV